MYQRDVAGSCQAEFERLQTVKGALRITMRWRTPAVGMPRKIESLLFIMRALQRHLERQLSLEEQGGYLEVVHESKPYLQVETERLRDEHDDFRASLEALVPSIESLAPNDEQKLEFVCQELDGLLAKLEAHELRESQLIRDAVWNDEGGEG